MKVNVKAQLQHYRKGIPLWKDQVNGEPLTLRDLAVGSLRAMYPYDPNEPALSGWENLIRRSYLADRIEDEAEVELNLGEVSLLKKCIGIHFPDPGLVRAVETALIPPAPPVPEPEENKTRKKK